MRLLLDTHVFIWWDSSPEKLSPEARRPCQDVRNTLILSVASIRVSLTDEQALQLAEDLNTPRNGQLVEFSFVIRSYVLSLLSSHYMSAVP
jgi:PIN domain nuclease of toxin-antitoxin system